MISRYDCSRILPATHTGGLESTYDWIDKKQNKFIDLIKKTHIFTQNKNAPYAPIWVEIYPRADWRQSLS
jgi:hypothetical protein